MRVIAGLDLDTLTAAQIIKALILLKKNGFESFCLMAKTPAIYEELMAHPKIQQQLDGYMVCYGQKQTLLIDHLNENEIVLLHDDKALHSTKIPKIYAIRLSAQDMVYHLQKALLKYHKRSFRELDKFLKKNETLLSPKAFSLSAPVVPVAPTTSSPSKPSAGLNRKSPG